MAELGKQIDIAMYASADDDPLRGSDGVLELEATDHKPLPQVPPHPLLSLREVGPAAPAVPGCWRFEAVSSQVVGDEGEGKGVFLVNFLNVKPGEEEEVGAWFVDEHLPDLLALPGFISGQRFQAAPGQDLPYQFLNLWEVDPEPAIGSLKMQRGEREEALAAGRQPKVRVHSGLLADQRMGAIYRTR